jgi:hypothetical protein
MTFKDQTQAFSVKTFRMAKDVFVGCTEVVHESITTGHVVTAAPGQPVQSGALLNSWTPQFIDANTWQDTTHLSYAPSIEDLVSYAHGGTPITIRSAVGGGHSVKMTRVAWSRIVEYVTQRVRGKA